MKTESFIAECSDGVVLRGLLLVPDNPIATVQLNCGTGTKKEFYFNFARYLAEHGYLCCLWDYRDTGESAPPSLKGCDYTYSDYGLKDMPAIKQYLRERFAELPFFIVGHSTGGQQVGLMPDLSDVDGFVSVAVSVGYMPNFSLPYRLQAFFFFYVFAPFSVALLGYSAGKRFGFMENLPRRVVREWRDWCEKKDYFFDEKFSDKTVSTGSYKEFDFPIYVLYSVDDNIANERNTYNFWQHVKSKQEIEFVGLDPGQLGLSSIGHFGYFKREAKSAVWDSIVQRLELMRKGH